ncbi:Neurochondrin-domain-containing protein [Mycotypha africana]|uniref:Neurochondrin-domain-containing protein n=1 Tax=Mycotypha africana TaxID=64632 RepID=UPI0023006937|nr:Neurochondrin-domain-containing protein [Mycotypha africana]KAI8975240.1 Neurochondrin-domain-containing protein [Mycotypha africana]
METVASSSKDRSAEIDRCLSMIAPSASNESKFVGMMILPKLLEKDNMKDIEKVFKGMNFKFLERLLRTNQVEGSELPDSILKEIAVNVLSCFARYEMLASEKNMVERIPALSLLLSPHDQSDVTKEVLQILLHIAVKKEGLVKMLDPDVLKNVFDVLLNTQNKEERESCTELINSVYTRSAQLLDEEKIPSLFSTVKYSLNTLLSILSNTLNNYQDLLKFEALKILSTVLPAITVEMMTQVKLEQEKKIESWLDNLLNGLRQILTSKLNDTLRDNAMLLVSALLRHFGNDWLFKSLQDTKSAKRKKEKAATDKASEPAMKAYAKATFPFLLINLVAIEAKVMLDDINDRVVREHNEEKTIIQHERQARQEMMIPVYFEILEAAMEYLAFNYESNGMDPELLLKIRTTLSEVMEVVSELLKFLQGTRESLDDNLIAQACIRMIALWMAEEGYEMPE